jgi:ABC-type phosphate transport system substrate-binding protein
MARIFKTALVLTILLLGGLPTHGQEGEFLIVVNRSNPTDSMTSKKLARIFVKKDLKWPSGFGALAVDLAPESPVRTIFSNEVLGRTVAQTQSYWQRALFSGLDVPLPELANDAEVLAFVSQNASAVGYIGAETETIDGTRVLEIKP